MAESSAADIEMGHLNANTTLARGPQHFFQEISEFGVLLNNTTNLVKKLKEANLDFSSVTGSDAMKEIKQRMEKDLNEVGKMAHVMKEKLDRIFPSALTPILNDLPNGRGFSVTLATLMGPSTKSMVRALKKKVKGTKKDLENLRKTIWKEYLEVVQRRTFTVAGIKLSDEVIRAIDTGSIVQMFANALQGIHPEQVVPAVDEIKERHAAVMDFDKKITELQQNFAEMAALVETRQKIDRAMNEVQKALTRARSTDEELRYERTDNEGLFAVVICVGLLLLLSFLW